MIQTIPTGRHLNRLYFELAARGAPCSGEKSPWPYAPANLEELLCLAADMSRFDPRLITVLLRFLSRRFDQTNPAVLRKCYKKMRSPQTWGVLADFLAGSSNDAELRFFCDYLKKGLSAVPLQFYFHNLFTPGGYLFQRSVDFPLKEYKQWGFLATEAPVIHEAKRNVAGSLDKSSRMNLLQKLLAESRQIGISDYLKVCRGLLSRQQALLDLKAFPKIRLKGHGRGALWSLG